MTNGIGKHGHDDKKGEPKAKKTTKTATAATLKKGVKEGKKPKTK
jgi:hypothetical protein